MLLKLLILMKATGRIHHSVTPTSPQAEVSWRIEYFQLKESVRKALDKKRQSHF
jgi:hypothetical protein